MRRISIPRLRQRADGREIEWHCMLRISTRWPRKENLLFCRQTDTLWKMDTQPSEPPVWELAGGWFVGRDVRPWRRGSWRGRRRCAARSRARGGVIGSSIRRFVRPPVIRRQTDDPALGSKRTYASKAGERALSVAMWAARVAAYGSSLFYQYEPACPSFSRRSWLCVCDGHCAVGCVQSYRVGAWGSNFAR